jgi:hypothetical protein
MTTPQVMAVITSPEPLPKSLVEIVINQATSYQVWDYLTMHTFHYIKFFLYLNIKSVPVPQSALTLPLFLRHTHAMLMNLLSLPFKKNDYYQKD